MSAEKVADLTIEELEKMIESVVHRQILENTTNTQKKLTWKEFVEAVDRIRWTPPPGTPSVTELLREDRDR